MTTVETFRNIRKNAYRDRYEYMMMWKKLMDENPTTDTEAIAKRTEALINLKHEVRCASRRMDNDRISRSIRCPYAHRFVYPYGDDYPATAEFWYEPDNGKTDEELNEYCENNSVPYIWREYSPTGQWSTDSFTWKRTPYGIRFIHRMSMDC